MSGRDHGDHRRSLKRPRSRDRSRSRSRSFSGNGSEGSTKDQGGEGKVSVQISIPDGLVGSLMADDLKRLLNLKSVCSPVNLWIEARSSHRARGGRRKVRTMLLRGDSRDQLDQARVKIHQFFHEELKITVDGVLPPGSPPCPSTSSRSHLNSRSRPSGVDEQKPLVLPFHLPTPTPTVSRTRANTSTQSDLQNSPGTPGASSLLHENFCPPGNLTSEGTIPVFMEVNEEFMETVGVARDTIKWKFPDTEVSLQEVSEQDNPDQKTGGAAHVILVRASNDLSLEVAKFVITRQFREDLGISLEEQNPGFRELKKKLEKSEEVVRKHRKEINNLRDFIKEKSAYNKEKYNKKEEELVKIRMKLESSQSDFESAVNEKVKLSKQVIDLESQLEEHSEFIRIFKSCDRNDNENPEDDQNKEMCLKCPHLLFENKNLRESLSLAEGLVSLREQELDLMKKKKPEEENNANISG